MEDQEDIFEQFEREHREFLDLIDLKEEADLFGVVGIHGSETLYLENNQFLTVFKLSMWKEQSSELQTQKLRVEMPWDPNTPDQRFYPFSVVHLRAKIAQHPGGHPQAWVTQVISTSHSDPDFKKHADRGSSDVTYDDPKLGQLVLDKRFSCFEGQLAWNDAPLKLLLDCSAQIKPEELIQISRTVYRDLHKWDAQAKAYAASTMLELKNSNWLDEDEQPLSEYEFIERMTLQSINIQPEDGNFELEYDDGDLFWGHGIVVNCNISKGCVGTEI